MANTPQAKKRIRRNANRATINHSRISRIRTFVKAVESAIAAGKKKDAAEALKMVQPEIARGVARNVLVQLHIHLLHLLRLNWNNGL